MALPRKKFQIKLFNARITPRIEWAYTLGEAKAIAETAKRYKNCKDGDELVTCKCDSCISLCNITHIEIHHYPLDRQGFIGVPSGKVTWSEKVDSNGNLSNNGSWTKWITD